MAVLILQIFKMRKRISKSSGCSYLYKYFDELVETLNQLGKELSSAEISELQELIKDYAQDSRYNNFASANWMRYSARCFYCADYLVSFLPNEGMRESMTHFLNSYFLELIEHAVAPIIPAQTFDRYLNRNLSYENYKHLYDTIIRKAVGECGKCRYWRGNEITLALKYTEAVDRLIREYIAQYSDFSMLNKWLPILGTSRLSNFWVEYPESCNSRHSGRYERETVMKASDKMLDIHLELLSLWYWHNPQDMIDNLGMEDLIDILEVIEDEEFEKILRHAVTLPFNEKVESVLKHFTKDDEIGVVQLANQLLMNYQNVIN